MNVDEFNYLIKKVNHDKAALISIYDHYYPRIVMHIAAKYPTLHAKDIAQEFFLNLLKIQQKKIILNPTAWVLTSCDNIAKKILKTRNKVICLQDNILDSVKSPIDIIDTYIESDYIRELFKDLNPDSQKIFYMYYWEGYNLREISKKLGIKLSTVKQKHSRGIKKLKKKL